MREAVFEHGEKKERPSGLIMSGTVVIWTSRRLYSYFAETPALFAWSSPLLSRFGTMPGLFVAGARPERLF
jgi:hypothetical protein